MENEEFKKDEGRLAAPQVRDRLRGTLVGLAVGDALGAAVEFQPPGMVPPVTGYRKGEYSVKRLCPSPRTLTDLTSARPEPQ